MEPARSAGAAPSVDLYGAYGRFEEEVLARVRARTFDEDFGQNGWTTADEYRRWSAKLALRPGSRVLEVACGSGGPALFLASSTGARVAGIDVDENAVATAGRRAAKAGAAAPGAEFRRADGNEPLPFADATFDALLCVDAANHFPDRPRVLREWRRVLRPGGRVLFTDPVVVTGPVTSRELALRASIGPFLFAPPGSTERLLDDAGLELLEREDLTDAAAGIARRWHDARAAERDALVRMEGERRFEDLQAFFEITHRLASERRLSRFAYLARRADVAGGG
jgi:SAM-dependent methyltransferase